MIVRCALSLLALGIAAVVSGCPSSESPTNELPDVVGPDAAGEVFDPTQMKPYNCDYTPAGPWSKDLADACNVLTDDCPTGDLGCTLTEQGAQCLPRGDATCGFPCERVNDCTSGLLCVGEPFACRAACRPGDMCPGDTVCREISGRPDLGFCPVPCSVLEPDCPGGDACYLIFGRMECAPTVGTGTPEGESCDYGDECAEGLICQDAADRRCLQPCSTDGQYECSSEQVCSALVGLEPLGVCVSSQP